MSKKKVPSEAVLKKAKAMRRTPPEDAVFDYLSSFDGEQLRYARFPASRVEDPKGTVIFVPGRTEFIEKFFEDVHVFNALGFAAASLDLRGQGMSFRPHPDRDKHFVRSFDPHINDLKAFFETAIQNKMPAPYILMGHSAGSHVILRFLHDHPEYASKAITVAPMVDIYLKGMPLFVVKMLTRCMRYLGLGAQYIAGHTAFKEGRWGWRKKLTHDDERFQDEDYFIQNKDRRLAVGGATYKWLHEAIKSCEALNAKGYPEAIETPVLVLQATEDVIVDNKSQTALVARMPNATLVKIDGAMHEILKETDDHRRALWDAVAEFIDLEGTEATGNDTLSNGVT